MIRIFLITLALFYLAIPAIAQTVQVRSGEHERFSRLTLNLPQRVAWSIEPADQGASIQFASNTLRLDPSLVFERIPRDRLIDVAWHAGQARLELRFGCACKVNAFWFGDAMLVLDVSEQDTEATEGPGPETVEATWTVPPQSQSRAASLLTPFSFNSRNQDSKAAIGPDAETSASKDVGVEEARKQLLEQFSRAATQGLISPKKTLPSQEKSAREAEAQPDTQAPKSMQDQPELNHQQINLRASSQIDLDHMDSLPTQARHLSKKDCVPDHQIDVASWGSTAPFGTQISTLRLQLTSEFDDTRPDIALDLARLYLFFGFGAEAKSILALVPKDTPSLQLLTDLAEIAEHGFARSGSDLAHQLDCESRVSLWSALSYETLPKDTTMNTDAILRGFNALPPHLRAQYGPVLSRRFLVSNRSGIASKLLRIVDRPEAPSSAAAEMAKAEAELSTGENHSATDRLEKVIERNVASSAQALVLMIEDRMKRREPISFEQAQLAGAFAFEMQNEAIAPALYAAHIRALAASGAFSQAQSYLQDRKGLLEPEQIDGLEADLARLLTQNADDMTFLRHTLTGASGLKGQLDPNVANLLARRLAQLGFPSEASKIISDDVPPNSALFVERSILRAELALALGKPRQAIVEVLGVDGAEANLVRARALSEAGDHAAAYHLFQSAEATDEADREAWLDGNWERAARPEVRAIDALADSPASSGPGSNGLAPNQTVLAANRDLIAESNTARETVSSLLAANPLPEANVPRP